MINESSKSEKQRRFFSVVLCYKRGDCKVVSDEVKKAADSMSMEDIEDFAKGPIKEHSIILTYKQFVNENENKG